MNRETELLSNRAPDTLPASDLAKLCTVLNLSPSETEALLTADRGLSLHRLEFINYEYRRRESERIERERQLEAPAPPKLTAYQKRLMRNPF